MNEQDKMKFRAFAEAMIITNEYEGVPPNYKTDRDGFLGTQEDFNEKVDNLMVLFEELYQEKIDKK